MDEEILFIRQLDLPIFSELAEVLNEENGWSVLLRFLPKNALGSFDLNKIKKSFAFCKNPSLELLTNLNITVQQLMHCLTEANLFKALEVIKEDEPLLILQDVPEEVILSSGGKLYITCDVVGFPPPCCQWFHGKTLLPNQNSNHLCIDQISVENSGLYTCRIHKPNRKKGNMDFLFTKWCKVIVEDQHTTESDKYETDNEDISPYICQQPSVEMVLKGENCEISCTAYAIPPPSFHWYKDGNPTENRKSTLMIKNAKSFDQGTYKCKVSNKLGSVWTEAASVEIGLKILKHPAHQSDRYVEYGTSILLECVARSNCQVIYTWYKGPEAIPDSNCSSLKLTNDNKGNDVEIWYVGCVAADGVESAMSKQVVVKFLPKNEITSFTAEDKIALLIANQRYDHLCDLKSAISDAHTMSKILEEMEFKVITVCDLNLLEIKNIVNLFCVFYYAGHGFQLQGQCFILPVDVSESYCTAECFNIEDLVDMMQLHNPGLA
ncbi:Mucosa-associated lymphoid tissue lymphoma translocation protein 1 [Nymphon striatum]|nr:Mucosa-associated lymphoid tissue lymphoma translocation protein 1 [Nymphon striatum]